MASYVWLSISVNLTLCFSALFSSYKLFKDHRAPSVGLFLVGLSAGLCVFPSTPIQKDAEWVGEILAPSLLAFHLMWLSEDHSTACMLLIGSCLLLGLRDSLSADTLVVLSRCLGLASLSCSLMVCLFAGNPTGALTSVALSLPVLLVPTFGRDSFGSLVSLTANEVVIRLLLKGSMSVGCWVSTHSLHRFLMDVTDRYHLHI
ncbi:transmembrane protein 276-like [Nerophis lumbriciformis]|uniref:transmembrane protein 276-like n=1 Tax=Nerophis lumbriciformis TaxID=546530 RepID=UPI002ADFAA11|nr:uncharacterized protein LOC133601172 [Nerophis lumbriciformis]